ncbi:hypothetical protein EJ04DRAFT_607879 [Polyplosphaeria fusca]|uniref:Uncharacterized protein n=1 Tax=Polyplosphaeria fusca TaxID=682080 RepID=A0A9P4RAK5_9PLEO|nr:hypothetical protein EJ04DRAFT_607879 [Polyplosphaeria fusca]
MPDTTAPTSPQGGDKGTAQQAKPEPDQDITPKGSQETTTADHLEKEGDQGLIPHAGSASTKILELASELRDLVGDAAALVEKKVNELDVEQGPGPYGSPGTCAPSDLDAIASGALPAVVSQETAESDITGKHLKDSKGAADEEEHKNSTK